MSTPNTPTRPAAVNATDWRCLSPQNRELVAMAHAAVDTIHDPCAGSASQSAAAVAILDPGLRLRLMAAAALLRRRVRGSTE